MRNAGLEEAQAGIKIAGRNINNFRYADDTKILNFKKNKIRYWLEAGGPITAPPVHLPLDLFVHNVSMKMKVKVRSVLSDSLRPHGLYSPWNSPGQNTGVGSCSLLQGIFPTAGIKPRSPALQADSLPAELPGKLWYPCI